MRFVKAHGTGNDFVVLPDPDGTLTLTPELVAAMCDRRRGVGADGVLRVVRAGATHVPVGAGHAEWFMDYWNADGGVAEMCGNGIRVYARYLIDAGLLPAEAGEFPIATRAGVKVVRSLPDGDISVDMGPPEVQSTSSAQVEGRRYPGLRISLGNPHLACVSPSPIADLDLSVAPVVDPSDFPDGVNVELVRPIGDRHVTMRVYERGVGETWSCGTGAVAAAVAAARADASDESKAGDTGTWRVDVAGGALTVTLDGRTSHLSGPAVLIADGEIREHALVPS